MNADAHHTRAHTQWSASATSRNSVCAGAIAMETLCEDRESEAAAWGTCAHQLAEKCLRGAGEAISFLGETEKSGKFEFVVDEDMANCSQSYVDYCNSRVADYLFKTGEGAQFWIEQKLSLDALSPPIEAGGTGDFIIYFPLWRLIEVVDLKGGRGVVVDVKGNPQGRTYAIGALLSLPGLVADRVRITIVQPRVGDGKPTHDDFHVADLLDWTSDLLNLMARSKLALDEFEAIKGNRVLFDEWAEKWLTTGQCIFCAAKGICPKYRAEALAVAPAIAQKWFEEPDDSAPPDLSNTVRLASPEELAKWLDGLEMLEGWISAVRGHAHRQAENGVAIPGYQLADRIGNRAWMLKDQGDLCDKLQTSLNLTGNEILAEVEVKSVAQIEKTIGAKRKGELAKLEGVLWEKPLRGTNLVAVTKTARPAAKSLPERHFEQL